MTEYLARVGRVGRSVAEALEKKPNENGSLNFRPRLAFGGLVSVAVHADAGIAARSPSKTEVFEVLVRHQHDTGDALLPSLAN